MTKVQGRRLHLLAERENVFPPFSGDAGAHQFLRGRGEDDFRVRRGVIRVRMTYERHAAIAHGLVRVQPQAERRQLHRALLETDFQRRHVASLAALRDLRTLDDKANPTMGPVTLNPAIRVGEGSGSPRTDTN